MTSLSSARPSGQTPPPAVRCPVCGSEKVAPTKGNAVGNVMDCLVCYTDFTPRPAASVEGTTPPSLRELAERTLATGESLRALRAAPIVGTTKEYHTADMQARQTFNQAFDAFSEAATPAAIIALSDELASTRSALREAQEDAKRWQHIKQFLTVEQDGDGEYLFYNDDQISAEVYVRPGYDNTVDELMDATIARAALDAAAGSTT